MSLSHSFDTQHAALPFSGVLSIRQHGATLFERAAGLASRPHAVPNTLDTRFGMASGSKTFTAVAVCQLVDRGLLAFDTPLTDCLDLDFPALSPAVTVHHLLSHTSGLPDYFDEEEEDDYAAVWQTRPMYAFRAPADFLPLFRHLPAKFPPGQRWAYNNGAYILLGLLVEKLTGLPFNQYVEEHIFKPCGMTGSGYFWLDNLPDRTAAGYIEDPDGSYRANIYSLPIVGGPDGGAYTTLADLARFWDSLLGRPAAPNGARLLSPTVLQQMLTLRAQTNPSPTAETAYAYGLWISRQDGALRAWYMLGEDPGAAFFSAHYPAQDLEFTLIGNLVPNAWAMFDAMKQQLPTL